MAEGRMLKKADREDHPKSGIPGRLPPIIIGQNYGGFEMEKKTYSEKLKDPRWQKKRLEILERDSWTCKGCGAKERTLHVHHIFYFPGKDPWEIENGFLITLCEDCHKGGPCIEDYKSCEECPDFGKDNCEGSDDIPEIIRSYISDLLNIIWKMDKTLSCHYVFPNMIYKLGNKDIFDGMSSHYDIEIREVER